MKKNEIYFKRKVYDAMLRWKKERNGATALLIQGAFVVVIYGSVVLLMRRLLHGHVPAEYRPLHLPLLLPCVCR